MKIRVENTKGRRHTRLYKLKEKFVYKTLIEKENTNRKFRDRNTIGPLTQIHITAHSPWL